MRGYNPSSCRVLDRWLASVTFGQTEEMIIDSTILSLLPVAVLLVLAWAVMHGIRRFANKRPPAAASDSAKSGVGGWLLLLVLGLMFLGPLMGAGRLNTELISAEAQYPNLKVLDAWGNFKSATWWSYLVVCCLSFYAGWGLAKGRDPSVVKRAKVLLWIVGPVASLIMGVLIPLIIFGKFESDPQFFGNLVASIVVTAIWWAYLSKSRRVRSTYGIES